MLNNRIAAFAAAITMTVCSFGTAEAMGIGSAGRAIGVTASVATVQLSERAKLTQRLFCLQYGTECRTTGKSVVAYTNKLRTVLASVNRSVNRVMPGIQARREFLSLNRLPANGDDYAMMKRSRLIRSGIPAGALRVVNVRTSQGIGHAVLVVRTSTGEFVLDHERTSVLKVRDSGYRLAALTGINVFE